MQQRERQRLEAGLARDLPPGTSLRLVRQVEVFEPRLRVGLRDGGSEVRRELALFLDAPQDRRPSIVQVAKIREALLERAELGVVEPSRRFLPVAGDERDGGFVIEQRNGRVDLRHADVEFAGNAFGYGHA